MNHEEKLRQAADRAERFRLRVLRLLSKTMALLLLLNVLCGIWAVKSIRNPKAIMSLVIFLFVYGLFFLNLIALCILCKRLRIIKRLIIWILIWIPLLHYGIALYIYELAKQELDHNTYKILLDDVRVQYQICHTRYPLLFVHGVGFRDFHYFNYWGRIPRELVKNGAKVYYGHQEAWGTVEDNAQILKERIENILLETGCEKVNIIAHSKGGLDARYLISCLHMAPFVASLTTINTPHRGSMLVDFFKCLPDGIYRTVCRLIDRYFSALGDKNPNAYEASRQLSCAYAKQFNESCKDAPQVYYQSYASLMRCGFSSKLLCVPYWILKWLDGSNDGLVTVESAVWGEFRGVIENGRLRGISHGDVIYLTREDYRDFKVVEFYIRLVQELAMKNF